MDLLEDMTSLKMLSPDKYADKAYVAGVAKRHACYLAKVEYNGEVIFENE
jgi:hypothetical protein